MPYESCAEKYSHYFSPGLKKIFKEFGASIPFILEVLDEDCLDTECRHHVLFLRSLLRDPESASKKAVDQPWVKQCHGCLCLLHLTHDDDLTMGSIAKAIGVSRNMINLIEQSALKTMRFRAEKRFAEKGGGSAKVIGLSDIQP